MNRTRVKATITYSDGTERTAYMSADSAKNLVGNACRGDNLGQIKKIEIEYIEDTAYKFRSIIVGLNAGIEALRKRNLELHAGDMKEIFPSRVIDEMVEQNEAAIKECKKYCNYAAEILHTAEKLEAEYDQVTISEDGTIDNQRKAAAKTDRHEDEKREKFLVILGADVDMEKASKQGFINIK